MSANSLRRLPICVSRWVDLRTGPLRHRLRQNRIRQHLWTDRATGRPRFSKFTTDGSTSVKAPNPKARAQPLALSVDPAHPAPRIFLGGNDGQPQPLAQRPRHRAPRAMSLPRRGGNDLFHRGPFGTLQQQDQHRLLSPGARDRRLLHWRLGHACTDGCQQARALGRGPVLCEETFRSGYQQAIIRARPQTRPMPPQTLQSQSPARGRGQGQGVRCFAFWQSRPEVC
jgi:hypothetical protein